MSRLIGLNGFRTAGKDTTYEIIAELRSGVKRGAFADKLKIMAMRALGYDGSPGEMIGLANKFKEEGYVDSAYLAPAVNTGALIPHGQEITGREYLQHFGNHARLLFGESFWVDQVLPRPVEGGFAIERGFERMTEIIDPWTLEPRGDFSILCITDVRYPNEAQRVLDLGGEMWEIRRPGLQSDGHASETPLSRDLVNVVIENDGDKHDLRNRVAAWL